MDALHKAGANPNLKDVDGTGLLGVACSTGNAKVVEKILRIKGYGETGRK